MTLAELKLAAQGMSLSRSQPSADGFQGHHLIPHSVTNSSLALMMLEAWGREKNGGNDYIGHNSLDDNIMYLSSSDVGPNGSTATGLAMHSGWDADHSSYNNFVRRITNKWDADPAVEKLGSE